VLEGINNNCKYYHGIIFSEMDMNNQDEAPASVNEFNKIAVVQEFEMFHLIVSQFFVT
jgi:hypothetical protein